MIIAGHAFLQNLRRGHYELAVDTRTPDGSLLRSLNSPARSDLGPQPRFTAPADQMTQQRPYEHHRWRNRVRYARPMPDLSVYDVPLILDEGEDPFSDYVRSV